MRIQVLAVLAISALVNAHGYGCPASKCAKSATPYCSSYLKVPKQTTTKYTTTVCKGTTTVTKSQGTKTVRGPPLTTTIIETITPTSTVPEIVLTDTTSITILAPTCTAPAVVSIPVEKRSYGERKPDCFKNYQGKAAISSACKCLHVKPSTKTVYGTKYTTKTVTTTVPKTTVSQASTVTERKTETADATTTTSKSTSFTTTIVSTVFSGPVAIPTTFNIVVADPQAATPQDILAPAGFRAIVNPVGADTSIDFANPGNGLATTFSLNSDGGLLAAGQTEPAFLSDIFGNDPQQVSLPNMLDTSNKGLVECQIVPRDDSVDLTAGTARCELVCTGTPFQPSPTPQSRAMRKRGILDTTPDPVPETVMVPLICNINANNFYLGTGNDLQTTFQVGGIQKGTCTKFTPVVVDAQPLVTTPDPPIET